jgi:uncharacterized glyoxalase superfamily protein PhnB
MSKLFRVILPVSSIEKAARFYSLMLGMPGERVSPGRHYFNCGGTILACFDPRADGDDFDSPPNPNYVYFAEADLDGAFQRAKTAGCLEVDREIKTMPWGERMFYAKDPFGNPISFVDEQTLFTGHSRGQAQ